MFSEASTDDSPPVEHAAYNTTVHDLAVAIITHMI